MIQIDKFEQGIRPLHRTRIEFSNLSLEVGGLLRDRIDFRFLTGEWENPSRGKEEDGKNLVRFH
jgi:glycyl-tRNA synthetase alpha subunit